MKPLFIFSILSFLFACQSAPTKNEVQKLNENIAQGEAQGTTYTVKYIGEEKGELKRVMDSLLNSFDESLSTYIPNSLVSQFNQSDSTVIDQNFRAVFLLSNLVYQETDGSFDPSIGPLIKSWGFDYANPQRMDSATVDSLLVFCGMEKFELKDSLITKKHQNSRLNFNAIAQGYAVDLMAERIEKFGITDYYVELGGELKVKGKNKRGEWWMIGIDRPEGANLDRKLGARISLENKAMATSGNYRKYYEVDGKRYSHTLNPRTGFPAENNLLSATVIAADCGLADAYATAFMVMGTKRSIAYLEKHPKLSAYLISSGKGGKFETYFTPDLKSVIEEF